MVDPADLCDAGSPWQVNATPLSKISALLFTVSQLRCHLRALQPTGPPWCHHKGLWFTCHTVIRKEFGEPTKTPFLSFVWIPGGLFCIFCKHIIFTLFASRVPIREVGISHGKGIYHFIQMKPMRDAHVMMPMRDAHIQGKTVSKAVPSWPWQDARVTGELK